MFSRLLSRAHLDRQGLGMRIASTQERNDNLLADNTIFVMFSYAVAAAMYAMV